MTNKTRIIILITIFSLTASLAPLYLYGQTDTPAAPQDDFSYKLVVPLPQGGGETATKTTGIADLIITWYRFGWAIAGVLAMAMVIYGGFQWFSAGGNAGRIGEAKERITGAVLGLLLLLLSFVILRVINPSLLLLQEPLLNIMIDIEGTPLEIEEGETGGGSGCPPGDPLCQVSCASLSPPPPHCNEVLCQAAQRSSGRIISSCSDYCTGILGFCDGGQQISCNNDPCAVKPVPNECVSNIPPTGSVLICMDRPGP